MLQVRRVGAVASILALAAICTSTVVWGEPGRDAAKDVKDGRNHSPQKPDPRFPEKVGPTRFTDKPVVTYQTTKDEHLIAVQLQPALPPVAARPCDYLVLVDTSASKAQGPLVMAQK